MRDDSNPKIGTTGNWMLLFPVLLCVTTAQAISGIRIPPHLAVVLSISPCFCLRSAIVFADGFVLFCHGSADCIAQPSTAQFIWGSRCVTSLLNDLGERAFSQFFQHASTRNDQIGRTPLREYWLYRFFFFPADLKACYKPSKRQQ